MLPYAFYEVPVLVSEVLIQHIKDGFLVGVQGIAQPQGLYEAFPVGLGAKVQGHGEELLLGIGNGFTALVQPYGVELLASHRRPFFPGVYQAL